MKEHKRDMTFELCSRNDDELTRSSWVNVRVTNKREREREREESERGRKNVYPPVTSLIGVRKVSDGLKLNVVK